MTPEEKYHSDRWFVFQKIRERELYAPDKNGIDYYLEITPFSKFEEHPPSAQINILKQLVGEGAIEIIHEENKTGYGAYYLFVLQIKRPRFDELYRHEENFRKEKVKVTTPANPPVNAENSDEIKSQPNGQIANRAEKKKLCVLEKLKEEHDLTPKTAVRTHVYFGYSHVRPAGEAWLYEQKLLTWIQECNLSDRLELENILAIFQQEGLVSKFIYSEQEGNLKIQFPEEFEGWYDKYKKKNVILPPPLSDNFDTTRRAHTVAIKKELEKEDLIKEVISRIPNKKFGSDENPLHIVIKDVKKDIGIRGFEEKVVLQKPKNKLIQLRNFPSDLRWEEISIQFLNEHEVIIKARNETLQTIYEAMGFQDEKRKLPNKQWQFLRLLALKKGEISWESNHNLPLKQINSIKKQKQLLTEALKAYFQISNDEPFHDYKTEKAYKIKLTLTPEPELKGIDEREVYDE